MVAFWLSTPAACRLCLRPGLRQREVPWVGASAESVVLSLAYCFAVALVIRTCGVWGGGVALVHLALLGAVASLCYGHRSILAPIGRVDLLAWSGCAFYVFNKWYLHWHFGLASLLVEGLIPEIVIAVHFGVICSLVIRLERVASKHGLGEYLTVVTASFAAVAIIGLGHYGMGRYYSLNMAAGLRAAATADIEENAARLVALDRDRQREPALLEEALAEQLETLGPGDNWLLLHNLGAVAMRYRVWDVALATYQRLVWEAPNDFAAQVRLASAQFESGGRKQALKAHMRLAAEDGGDVENWLALGVARAKMGAWTEAEVAFAEALDRAAWSPPAENGVVSLVLERDVEDAFRAQIGRMAPYEWGTYFRQRGWSFFADAMAIGYTGVMAPARLEAFSGGGGTWDQEGMMLGEYGVSLRKRGYNIAVIDPVTGELDGKMRFDTWENKAEGTRLAYFLQTVPRGKIVMGTVNDEGSGGLTRRALSSLRALGTRRQPTHWGSHAFIGVKGREAGSALEAVANQDNGRVMVGAAAGNAPEGSGDGGEGLEQFLLEAARAAAGGRAILLSLSDGRTVVSLARG